MKIRAITLGLPGHILKGDLDLNPINELKEKFLEKNIEVQTIRLSTPAFSKKTAKLDSYFNDYEKIFENIESLRQEKLIDYYSFLPGLCDQSIPLTEIQKKFIDIIPQLLKNNNTMFSSIQVSSFKCGISLEAIKKCANMIIKMSKIDSFMNLQFAAIFNVPPNTPFFPSSYHRGKNPKISIALEAADEIINILDNSSSANLDVYRKDIQNRFSTIYDEISDIIIPICKQHGIEFEGIDFSPAQYPEKGKSIGTAIEKLGLGDFGELGTVFSIGFLTSALKGINRPQIGFSGFMQPLLEDFTIAERNNEGKISITQLMLNSAVCGLGLDCIPLPGDISEETLTLLMMDISMISTRLNKPLTARLMPIKGKKAGELTEFDFEYFANSKICSLDDVRAVELDVFLKKNPGLQL